MTGYSIDPAHLVETEEDLRALFGEAHGIALKKSQTALDRHAREFIERAPFLCLATQNATGDADVSPRGDPPGFVRILDDRTLAIPDRPGNNRLDSLSNIVANPSVGLLFIVPGFDDTLRVNGRARLVTDPEILAPMAVNGRVPKLAIVVEITELFMHCAKAFRRSNLWDPDQFQDRRSMASLPRIIHDQTSAPPKEEGEFERMDQDLEAEYRRTLY
ncbi:pyridoxamine 5'-phosphate oxidase family protein [Histidinibacterium aquaticum]|uniref:Pyridoxamine 5'-phosphate oxidase family protein n=1 Tax=Histidinibacterium aquaticum TaxID=2613962 RepID=A0A5J5GJD0_9RHOB|nr:pyridoxamine 5'-phosphate oxidase family protein [Histidinibacterium aquaticum]KAA9008160.1 pyridoxamine 5'-phosphate oxidase family protein [Histidinibacterium aquaticum]